MNTLRHVTAAVAGVVALTSLTACGLFSDSDDVSPSPTLTEVTAPSASASPSPTTTDPTPTAAVSQEPEPTETPVPVAAVISISEVAADGAVTIGGFVNGFAEDDGICTFKARSGTKIQTLEQTGLQNMGTTACGSVTFAAGVLSSGRWSVTLDYDGAAGVFTSTPVEVNVP